MMDADAMYPDGFHPIRINHKPDLSDDAEHTSRAAGAVKYYFIDFGISVYIPENVRSKLVTGILGRDRDPPELSNRVPYDPFKLDIFIIGNMLKRDFYKVRIPFGRRFMSQLMILKQFSNVDFFKPLFQAMTRLNPAQRPTAKDALRQWQGIRGSISAIHREWRARPREEHPLGAVVFDAVSLHRFFMSWTKSLAKRLPM